MNIEAPQIVPSEKSTIFECLFPMGLVSGRWKRAEAAIFFDRFDPAQSADLGPGIRELGRGLKLKTRTPLGRKQDRHVTPQKDVSLT
jgi:hypothetical protein